MVGKNYFIYLSSTQIAIPISLIYQLGKPWGAKANKDYALRVFKGLGPLELTVRLWGAKMQPKPD